MAASFEKTTWRVEVGFSATGTNGAIQPARLLEWMQDAAVHASALGGYPPERYTAMGASWFIREVLLSIDAPIHCGEVLSIETWVSDLRRFRSRREYRVTGADGVVARAQADWMLLARDPQTGKVKPLRPDEPMMAAFPRVPETVLGLEEMLELGDDPAGAPNVPSDTRKVRPSELDRHGHVNHVVYLGWLEDHVGMALGGGHELGFVRMEYLADARMSDEVTIAGWTAGDLVQQLILREDKPILRAVMRRRAPHV